MPDNSREILLEELLPAYLSEKDRRIKTRKDFQDGKQVRLDLGCQSIIQIISSVQRGITIKGSYTHNDIYDLFYEIWDIVGDKTLQEWISHEPKAELVIKDEEG